MYKASDKVWFLLKSDLPLLSIILGRDLNEDINLTITPVTYESFLESIVSKKYFEIFSVKCRGLHLVAFDTSYLLNQLVTRDIVLKNKDKIQELSSFDKTRTYMIEKIKNEWLCKAHLYQSELILRLTGKYSSDESKKTLKTQIELYSAALNGLESYISVTYKKQIEGFL